MFDQFMLIAGPCVLEDDALNLAADVVIADSRVKNIEIHGYEMIGRTNATTIPDLDEYREFNDVKIYRSL